MVAASRAFALLLMLFCQIWTGAVALADAPPSDTPREPAKVYAAVCGYCHGANVGPIILGRSLPPALVQTLVRNGKNAMPSFRPTEISDAELSALAAWVAASVANPAEKGR